MTRSPSRHRRLLAALALIGTTGLAARRNIAVLHRPDAGLQLRLQRRSGCPTPLPRAAAGAAPAWWPVSISLTAASGSTAAPTFSTNYYNQLSELDNTSYAVNAGWDWETIERLSGTLTASASQGLGNYGGTNDTLSRQKNIQTSTALFATANYGLLSLLQFTARLGYSSVHYSAVPFARYELDQETITLGVRKQFSGQLTLGSGLTYTQGDYFSIGREFDRYDIFVSGVWDYSGLSRFSGRLNYTDITYTGLAAQDQSGLTGYLRWAYRPTGKLDFSALVSYDTLANSGLTDISGGVPVSLGDTSQLTAALRLTAGYAATSKIKVNATLNYYTRDNEVLRNAGVVETKDRVTSASLGATWTPSRNWLVACDVNLHDRNQTSPQPDHADAVHLVRGQLFGPVRPAMSQRTVLLTGATGYIGSHTWLALLAQGWRVVGVDDFSNSSPRVLDRLASLAGTTPEFERADVGDRAAMQRLFATHRPHAVVHFAAFKAVGESVAAPAGLLQQQPGRLLSVCHAMQQHDCRRLVFSSSATVYGVPQSLPISEDARAERNQSVRPDQADRRDRAARPVRRRRRSAGSPACATSIRSAPTRAA